MELRLHWQALEQPGGVHEIRHREAFRECVEDRRKRGSGCAAPITALEKAGKARRRSQFPRFALLAPGGLDGNMEARFGSVKLIERLRQQQLALKPVQFGLGGAIVVLFRDGQRLVERLAGLGEAAGVRVSIAQRADVTRRAKLRSGSAEGAIGPKELR